MQLPIPSATFTLPSLYDDLELDCRLYFPRRAQSTSGNFVHGFAIFAHPYASVGGTYDDPVVQSVGSTLLRKGFVLATFNFRGASGSAGRTSWSGKAELGDYVSVYAFILNFMNVEGVIQHVLLHGIGGNHNDPLLVLGGYSYGSLIASYLPSLNVVQSMVTSLQEGTSEQEIHLRAQHLAKAFLGYVETQEHRGRVTHRRPDALEAQPTSVTMGGYESDAASRRISRESSRRSIDVERVRHSIDRARHKLSRHSSSYRGSESGPSTTSIEPVQVIPQTAYLLVSPLMLPVAGLTTMFSKLGFERRGKAGGAREKPHDGTMEEHLTKSPTCAIYGAKDVFTSSKKLRKWCEDMQNMSESGFTFHEIANAGHFWHDEATSNQMNNAISGWLDGGLHLRQQ